MMNALDRVIGNRRTNVCVDPGLVLRAPCLYAEETSKEALPVRLSAVRLRPGGFIRAEYDLLSAYHIVRQHGR